jgi:uncharacterized membrane protein
MKSKLRFLGIVALATAIGCTQGTPGGPGTTGDQPTFGQADDTFNLTVPVMSSSLQQGESAEATIGIKRATNFDQDVSLQFADVPEGVTIEPANPVIKSSETDAKITFTAGDEAPLGDFHIKVTGHPAEGGDAQIDFKLTVVAKDSFTVSVPSVPTLKQGESETIAIGITRDDRFDQDVTLEFGGMPSGVSIEPNSPVIKQGETSSQVTLTAAEDASLGDFTIKVTGHPGQGAVASKDLKISVAASEEQQQINPE